MSKICVCLAMSYLAVSASAQSNLIRSDSQTVVDWMPSENVSLEVTSKRTHSAETAVKVTWQNVRELHKWAEKGNLLRSGDDVLTTPLKRDTRYRFHGWMFVEELEITPESRQWLSEYPDGMYDQPTVTIGCQGGVWNSGMPFAAYDISKPRTWQELSFEFVTSLNVGGEFSLHLDVYPCQGSHVRMCSSGTMFLEGVVLEECTTRIGFTHTQRPITIDGTLDDWWETNPVVITRDQIVAGNSASNHGASGIVYTMWNQQNLFLAAKIVDDAFAPEDDGLAVRLNQRRYVLTQDAVPAGWRVAVKAIEELGSTTNMYRISSQFGEEVRGRDGYIVEVAIPASVLGQAPDPGLEFEIAMEILDSDRNGTARRLRFPCTDGKLAEMKPARAVLANEKGELRGGAYPCYAITDAGNPRGRSQPLAIKNVDWRVLRHGRLGYSQALYRDGDIGKVDALVSWTTSSEASGVIEYCLEQDDAQCAEGRNGIGDASGIAMRALLRDLKPNRRYHCRVVVRANSESPRVVGESFLLDTTLPPIPGVEHGAIPLIVRETTGVARERWPVTSGIPFPQGHLGSIENLRLQTEDGTTVPAQFQVLSAWLDGSVRWVLLDMQADVPANGESEYTLEYGNTTRAETAETTLAVNENEKRISVDTGAMSFVVSKTDFRLFEEVCVGGRVVAGPGRLCMTDPQGREYVARRPDVVEVEELGPLRTCIRVAGRFLDRDGQPWFRYELRIHAYARQPFARIIHTYTCLPKGETGYEFVERHHPEAVSVGSLSLDLVLADASENVRVGTTATGGNVSVPLTDSAPFEMRQSRESEAHLGDQACNRLPGWAATGDLMIAERDFWQLYPNAISFRKQATKCEVRIGMMPEIKPDDYPSAPNTIEDWVWGYLRDGAYRLRRGEGRSHELFLTFGKTDVKAIIDTAKAQLAMPLVVQAEPTWYAGTRALGNFHPQDERFAEYDRGFDAGMKNILARRESETFFEGRFGLYGLRNFGDHFGSDGMNWDNLEYDFSHCCLTQYMRTGDLRLLQIGRECHLHNRDVDCLAIRPGFERLCHHTGDHSIALAGTGHTWCEGAWEYYFLTGDRRSARKALGISNDLAYRTAGLCAKGAPGAAGSREFGWSVVGLMAAYLATADPLYLNAAREVEEVVVRTQHPFAGGWIRRFSTGHCFHAPAHAGRIYFMQDIVLNGQVLFHQVTGDPDVQECIINACRGTMAEVRQRRAEGLPGMGYTSCPFLLTPGPWYPGRMKHGLDVPIRSLALYYACGLPGGENLANELFGLWPESGQLWSGSFPSQGKTFAQISRWAPRLMHYIAQQPGAPNPATEQSANEDK